MNDIEILIILTVAGQRTLRLTPEEIAVMSREDVSRALRYASGASIDPADKGSKPQRASSEILALL
jgi:hypothetical protein